MKTFHGPSVVPTRYWHRLDDGRIQCDLCPRYCKLHEGQRGFCFVRACQDGQIVLTTYGRSSGFCVDPIEKKPLYHFLPGTPVLSFGTAGCNLGCRFCQNWDISKSREIDTLADEASPEAIARAAEQLGCRSVAFTYNDPVIFHEYAIDVAAACRDRGHQDRGRHGRRRLRRAARGVLPAHGRRQRGPRRASPRSSTARSAPGTSSRCSTRWSTSSTRPTSGSRSRRCSSPASTTPTAELEELTRWVVDNLGPDVPLHFTAFHPDFRLLDRPPTPPQTLRRARRIACEEWRPSRLRRQRPRPAGRQHLLPRLRRAAHRPRLVRADRLAHGEGRCPGCGTVLAGRLRARPRRVGAEAPALAAVFLSHDDRDGGMVMPIHDWTRVAPIDFIISIKAGPPTAAH